MDKNIETQRLLTEIRQELKALRDEFYRNNFSANQDFIKSSSFLTKLKVPHYEALPAKCEQGEILEVGGKLYICSSTNVFQLVGGQT